MLSNEPTASNDILAQTFSALGDETRLNLIMELSDGRPQSIARLSSRFSMTRQAISKHLRVLEAQNLVHSARVGRETQFGLRAVKLDELSSFLDAVTQKWGNALVRLQDHVE